MPPPLLTAIDSVGHIHLVLGSNPLASARCTKSIEVGAKPRVIAPADAEVHYLLAKRIEAGEVEWIQRNFEETDLTSLGRDEVDKVVDAVFVTSGGKSAASKSSSVSITGQWLSKDHRHKPFTALQKEASTSKCGGCTKFVYLYPPLYPLRWTPSDWGHHFWERMQARVSNTARDCQYYASKSWRDSRAARNDTATDLGRGSPSK